MSIFKKKPGPDEFCRNYYERNILGPIAIDSFMKTGVTNTIYKYVVKVNHNYAKMTPEKINEALIPLHFELFALAWTHYYGGHHSIAQSVFTKRYLHEKKRYDIWEDMGSYNLFIAGGTLGWIENLELEQKTFWLSFKEGLSTRNVEEAKNMGLDGDDIDIIERANNRLCSDLAWKTSFLLQSFVVSIYSLKLGLELKELNKEVLIHLSGDINILNMYDNAYFSFKNVNIKD